MFNLLLLYSNSAHLLSQPKYKNMLFQNNAVSCLMEIGTKWFLWRDATIFTLKSFFWAYYPRLNWEMYTEDATSSLWHNKPYFCLQKTMYMQGIDFTFYWLTGALISNEFLWREKFGLKRCNRLVHPWWLTIVSFPFMGQPWKIMTRSSIQWLSIE